MPPLPPTPAPSAALLSFLKAQTSRPLTTPPVLPATAICLRIRRPSTARFLPASLHTAHFSTAPLRPLAPPPRPHTPYNAQTYPRAVPRRPLSSTRAARLWDFLSLKRRRPSPCRLETIRPLAPYIDDGSAASRIVKTTPELRLRCTEFDACGNVTLVNGEFRKSELIAKYGLLPRDLRKIDSSILPHILVRPSAILLNLLHLRVLIKYDRVLVFDAYGSSDSYSQSVFMYDLEGKLRSRDARANGSLPYELRALEAVLISVTSGLESEFEGVRDPVLKVLRELEEDIDRDKLRYLLVYSKKLGTFEQKARLVRDALDELLEADDDLAAMYLTDKAKGGQRRESDHTEVEMLLESYHKVADEIVQAAENLVSNIRNTEEIVKAILDANRNALMLLELRFSICTLGLGAGTFIAALYGMNLKNFIEESDLGFGAVSVACAAISAIVLWLGLGRLRRVQRVRMWGEGPPGIGLRERREGLPLPGAPGGGLGMGGAGAAASAHAQAQAQAHAAATARRERFGVHQQQHAGFFARRRKAVEARHGAHGAGHSASASASGAHSGPVQPPVRPAGES
ncbi:cora-domain-containing protein [Trichodelitschia bisporula]|uniref:Magnesium transporter n=1 Tax=Trichodelitschia bisporula TaxID=703511 RepID=A0A6G1I7U6_9PEZI|nr:cora-domain-containing protein [Trichodelitschia bisporula]